MQDAIAEFQAAPLWAQIAMSLFALLFLVMIIEPRIRRLRFRRRFDGIVRGLGAQPQKSKDWPRCAAVNVEGHTCQVRHDLRGGGRGSSYRGPGGYLLITVTPLSSSGWSRHQVDVKRVGGLLSRLVRSKGATGDTSFDERFFVVEDGVPVRDGWLDQATRDAIGRFLDEAPRDGLIRIRDRELQFIVQEPWTGLDGPVVRALLERQIVLASALDQTANAHRTQASLFADR